MFFKIINLLNLNYKYKKKFFKTTLVKNEMRILKKLIHLNFIKYIKKTNQNEIIIFLKYKLNQPILKINNLFRKSNIMYINYDELNKLTRKKSKIYLLSTSKGLLNNVEAQKNKTGGILVAEIKY